MSIFKNVCNQHSKAYSLELQQSALKLNNLIQAYSEELQQAEKELNIKINSSLMNKKEIFEQISLISEYNVRIYLVGERYKMQIIKQISKSWEEQIECLKLKWFVNESKQIKKGIGWREKTSFIQELPAHIKIEYEKCQQILNKNLSDFNKNTKVCYFEKMLQYHTEFINYTNQGDFDEKTKSTIKQIKIYQKICYSSEFLSDADDDFIIAIKPSMKALIDKGWGEITWEEVVQFKNEVLLTINKIVTSALDDRIKLVNQAAEGIIEFYNNFLEQQERYQETPAQRQAEKAWIEQQRQELAQLQNGVEVILKC